MSLSERLTALVIAGVFPFMVGTGWAADLGGAPTHSSYKDTYEIPHRTSWTGFYFGAGIGAAAINHELSVRQVGGPAGLSFDGIGGEGIFGTVQIGGDVQVGSNFVIGAFVDYDYHGTETDASVSIPQIPVTGSGEIPVDDMWSVGGRIGYLSSPSTLWYVGAAYSHMRLGDASGTINVGGGGALSGSFGLPSFDGYSLLTGVEAEIWKSFTLKLEYRFTQFDRETVAILGPADIGLEPSMHTARLVGSYRFNFNSR